MTRLTHTKLASQFQQASKELVSAVIGQLMETGDAEVPLYRFEAGYSLRPEFFVVAKVGEDFAEQEEAGFLGLS